MLSRISRYLFVFLFVLLSLSHSWAKLQSYREWKNDKINDYQSKISLIKSQIESRKKDQLSKKTELINDSILLSLEQKIVVEKYNLELAHDLSVTDYFVGYLNKVENKQSAFKELALKMTPEEVAEIMTAYANSVFGSREAPEKTDLSPAASNLKNLNGSP